MKYTPAIHQLPSRRTAYTPTRHALPSTAGPVDTVQISSSKDEAARKKEAIAYLTRVATVVSGHWVLKGLAIEGLSLVNPATLQGGADHLGALVGHPIHLHAQKLVRGAHYWAAAEFSLAAASALAAVAGIALVSATGHGVDSALWCKENLSMNGVRKASHKLGSMLR